MTPDRAQDSGEPAPSLPASMRPSKTRLKQDSHALQALGEALLELPQDRLDALPLPEALRDALEAARRTRSHEGRRRQMQLIGKLMRRADLAPIRQAVAELHLGRARDSLDLHEAERWRAELIASDGAATRWMAEHPGGDAQQLRSLVRSARKDAALVPEKRSGKAYRELFRFIRNESHPDDARHSVDGRDPHDARHPRAGGDPSRVPARLDSRLRGNDVEAGDEVEASDAAGADDE